MKVAAIYEIEHVDATIQEHLAELETLYATRGKLLGTVKRTAPRKSRKQRLESIDLSLIDLSLS